MKKRLIAILLVALILPSCISVAHANEGYAWVSNNLLPSYVVMRLLDLTDAFILDHDPSQGKVDYVSWISYDKLSEMSTGWSTAGVIVFNATMNAYFLRISYTPTSGIGGLKYGALGTSNGYCYGTKATEKSEVHIDNSVTIKKTTVINNPYIQSVLRSASKTATDVTTGLKNIIDWLSLQCEATMLVNKRLDVTNDLLYWIANNFQDMLYAIGQADLLIAEVGIYQLENLFRILDFLVAINQNQVFAHSVQYQFFYDVLSRLDALITNTDGINSRLDSVISNGVVQVGSASLEARLDKLISMYSKVNSVVLDTAAINGGQLKDAVGGELKDVVFWGDTAKVGNTFVSSDGVAYSLNDVKTTVNGLTLRSVNLGSTIPSYIANDPVLYAGVWRKGTDYIISDTYNASTGEYVQRVRSRTFDGSENWWSAQFSSDSRFNLFFLEYSSADDWYFIAENSTHFNHLPVMEFDNDIACLFSNYAAGISDSSITSRYMSEVPYILNGNGFWRVLSYQKYTLDSWKALLSDMSSAGSPFTVLYVPYSAVQSSTIQYLDPFTIAIPEGNSYISSYNVRITGKYETYDSYTQTADIITAINNIPPYDDSGLIAAITGMTTPTVTTDLTEVTSRLDLILAELQSTSGSASCEHTYTQHMEQDADCILPGLMISTCSQCGDSYSEIVDPLGHDWVLSSHVDAVTDPDTGEETASAYDVYTCSRCGRTYEDHTGNGAPDEDYSNTSISQMVVQVFSKLGTFAGKLIGFFVHLLDKALTSVDNVISKFNDYTAQISSFGGSYPAWLTGFWGIIPSELQAALTFSVICMALGAVGKKLLFS